MFVSFLYIYNMLLNTPNHPRCFDRDSMPALTLAGVVSASLGTNFAGGGTDVHHKLEFSKHKLNVINYQM